MTRDGPRALEAKVLEALSTSNRGPLKAKELARAAGVPTADYRRFKRLLTGLERAGKVYRVKGNRYATTASIDLVAGALSVTRRGDGFVAPDRHGDDVFVPSAHLGGAMHGDRVVVRIESRPRQRNPTGRVIRVLERAHESLVGTYHRARKVSFVRPLDARLGRDVLVPAGSEADAAHGEVVVVRIDSFGEGRLGPVGTVERVLGSLDDPGVDVLAVAYGFGISLDFPEEVERAARAAAEEGRAHPGVERVDRTDLLVFTIDPADAKDHDDALSIEELPGSRWRVGIHIADVSHFVVEGSPVDLEALARGTSVYLVDRTIPMLPHTLSGDVCSLRAGEDRLAVSLFVTLDASARVLERHYERSTIRPRHGLAYEEVQTVLDGSGRIADDVDAALRALDDLARHLRRARAARGALDLDLPEARVILDDDGLPLDIQRRERLESHRLIEDFMILANEVVAHDQARAAHDTIYRVHEPPSREQVEELQEMLGRFGLELPRGKSLSPERLQQLLDVVRDRPEATLVSTVLLRSLKRARYDPENLGHFGLASPAYLHFTSPIRRYPDLVVHRQVVRSLVNGEPPRAWDPDELRGVAERSSAREQEAAEAERASVALKKVEFMERHLGEEFDGHVSGVAAFGFFVTLERYFVDGLVHVNSLHDDFYRLNEEAYALVGDRGRRSYRLGDRLRVQVARVDKEARHVDFVLVRKLGRGD